jgi:hypothetical protein
MPAPTMNGEALGYARVSTGHQSLDQQLDALTAEGIATERIYRDKLSGTSTREQRPGLATLLDYPRPGDCGGRCAGAWRPITGVEPGSGRPAGTASEAAVVPVEPDGQHNRR